MFTGIITDIGALAAVEPRPAGARLAIRTALDLEATAIGASIACAGVCLTVIAKDAAAGLFSVDVSAETLSRTTLGALTPGAPVNLEPALKIGDELGGHIVSGHVDGVATLVEAEEIGDSTRWRIAAPAALAGFIAAKGSVALDGCSLTVNAVQDRADGAALFDINLIPHTKAHTSFAGVAVGAKLNLEIDLLARYIARLDAVARRDAARGLRAGDAL